MKKKIYFVMILLGLGRTVFCQSKYSQKSESKTKFTFLYVVDLSGRRPVVTENAFIAPSEKDTTFRLSRQASEQIRGLLKIDEIIYVKVKPAAKIITLSQVFHLYKIGEKYREYPIIIDDQMIEDPETLIISKSQISKVSVVKIRDSYYISIILKGYYEFIKKYPPKDGVVN
jgi:hypothetical protein